jgi:hypothetical protein
VPPNPPRPRRPAPFLSLAVLPLRSHRSVFALAALRSLGPIAFVGCSAASGPCKPDSQARLRRATQRFSRCSQEVDHRFADLGQPAHSGSPNGDPDRGAGPHKGKPNKHNTIKSSARCSTNIYPLRINGWRLARLWPLCAVGDAPAKRARQKSALDSASIRFQMHSTTSLRTQVRRDYMVSAAV